MDKGNGHPKQSYTHNLNKICKKEGCRELGYCVKCEVCHQKKRKTLCEKHIGEQKEMNRLLRGKLTVGIFYNTKK